MNSKHIQHLYWRAGFGINPIELERLKGKSRSQIVNELFSNSSTISVLELDTSEFDNYTVSNFKKDPELRQKLNNLSAKKVKEFNKAWIERMINPRELLREKMTLFWSNHFTVLNRIIFFVQKYNNTLRYHALGNFGDFVKAISKEAAMIVYLNTKQNLKEKPNENFARELLELFTLGVGNYKEKDIREISRTFTGYNHRIRGDFWLRKQFHDYGIKTVFGQTGYFNGDDAIDIILEKKQCARFICRKIYRYFVNDVVDENKVEELSNVFYKDYNIENLMRHIFMSDWFYSEENIGVKIKSPIELLVGICNTVPIKFKNTESLFHIQKILGQVLLNPPNVAGWEGGRSWVDSNTMLTRLRLASVLMNEYRIPINEKGGFIDKYRRQYFKNNSDKSVFKTEPDWKTFHANFDSFSSTILETNLILSTINKGTSAYLNRLNKSSKQEYCIQLMSIPEYQMC